MPSDAGSPTGSRSASCRGTSTWRRRATRRHRPTARSRGVLRALGPTTVERRSPWFMHQALEGCCRWNGPSWPFATSQTLTALANLLIDYPAQSHVDRTDYYAVLRAYVLTHRKDGKPYVAEAHHPDEDRWIYDGRGHSEDYNHSTFNDLVLSGLFGIRSQSDATVSLAPLVPREWDHFAVENLPYHGHNLSVLFDRSGRHYGHGAGLSVWLDGRRIHRQDDLEPVTLTIGRARQHTLPREVDDLANVEQKGHPLASASYTFHLDSPAKAIDGQDLHLDTPSSRWTNYGSPHADDWLAVDFGVPTPVSDLRISFYDDGGGVRTPDSYELHHLGQDGRWHPLPGQLRTPQAPGREPSTGSSWSGPSPPPPSGSPPHAPRAAPWESPPGSHGGRKTPAHPRRRDTVERPRPRGAGQGREGHHHRHGGSRHSRQPAPARPRQLESPSPADDPPHRSPGGKTLHTHWLVTAPRPAPPTAAAPAPAGPVPGEKAEQFVTSVVAQAQADATSQHCRRTAQHTRACLLVGWSVDRMCLSVW
ncbi:discoidin domain-containing protein [Streptomyces sp. INA 01156]